MDFLFIDLSQVFFAQQRFCDSSIVTKRLSKHFFDTSKQYVCLFFFIFSQFDMQMWNFPASFSREATDCRRILSTDHSRHRLTLVRIHRAEDVVYTCQIRFEPVKRRLAVSRDSIHARQLMSISYRTVLSIKEFIHKNRIFREIFRRKFI